MPQLADGVGQDERGESEDRQKLWEQSRSNKDGEEEREEKNEEQNKTGTDAEWLVRDDDERSSHCIKGLRKCQRRRRGSRTARPLFPAAAEFHR